MRHVISLSTVLFLLSFAPWAVAQETEETAVDVVGEVQTETPQNLQIVQLELWVVRLTDDVHSDVVEGAGLPLADRNAVLARIRELEQQGLVAKSQYLMASALDNQMLRLNLGAREPRVSSTQLTQFGKASSIQYDNVGVMLDARAKIASPDMVLSELQYEESYHQPSDVTIFVDKDGDKTTIDRTRTFVHQATVGCPNGGAVALMASGGDPDAHQPAMLMFLACKIHD